MVDVEAPSAFIASPAPPRAAALGGGEFGGTTFCQRGSSSRRRVDNVSIIIERRAAQMDLVLSDQVIHRLGAHRAKTTVQLPAPPEMARENTTVAVEPRKVQDDRARACRRSHLFDCAVISASVVDMTTPFVDQRCPRSQLLSRQT